MGTRSEQFELLLGVLRYDIEKRYGVLKDEVRHLIGGIAYRIGTEPAAAAKKTSQAAFLNLLKRSAQSLSDECDEDLLEIDRYAKIRNHWRQSYTVVKPEGQNEFAILWQAKMLHKASVIAERIGDLHNRLEQFLQRTNPDHPDTTLRRRTEQGLTDKYLSELSRWAHRDLVIFVKSMGARYPYDEVPATFQFWAYDHTSRHHSFIGTQGHKDWVRRIEATPTPNSKGLHPSKFVSVALSYWMPERAALQPIIGHELAHQVLRDLYGREVNFAILEQDESLFARTYRRLTTCVETWSVARAVNGTIDVKLTSNLVHEVLCDVLAAVRFGYAYAFAWILEILGDVQLARLSHDHYGMLRQIEPARGGSTDVLELIKGPYRQLSDDVLKASEYLRDILPRNYIRGIVLLRFLGRSSNETDEASSEFATAFEDLLKELLKIFAGANTQQSDIDSAFAGDLASALCDEWAFAEDDSLDSDFVNASRDLWRREGRSGGRHTNPSLDHQVITRGYRELVTSTLNNNADSMSWPSVKVYSDVAWRIEWFLEKEGLVKKVKEEQLNRIRSAYFLGMDDYLYRTGNPVRLFAALLPKETLPDLPTNTVDTDLLRLTYSTEIMERFDARLADYRAAGVKANVPIKLPVPKLSTDPELASQKMRTVDVDIADQEWIDTVILHPSRWRDLVGTTAAQPQLPEQCILELFRFKSDKGELGDHFELRNGGRYEPQVSGIVLGRYDAFAISRRKDQSRSPEWMLQDTAGQVHTLPYVSRFKRLVKVGSGNLPTDEQSPFAVVLVSLKWDASRTIVARWLNKQSKEFLEISRCMFLSDGWEDLVVVVSANKGTASTEAPSQCLQFIEQVNMNPFVSGTETLFTTQLVGFAHNSFVYRYICRVGRDGYTALKKRLYEAQQAFPEIEVRYVAGVRDFEIGVPQLDSIQMRRLHKALHETLRDCRLEMRVSWRPPSASPVHFAP